MRCENIVPPYPFTREDSRTNPHRRKAGGALTRLHLRSESALNLSRQVSDSLSLSLSFSWENDAILEPAFWGTQSQLPTERAILFTTMIRRESDAEESHERGAQ